MDYRNKVLPHIHRGLAGETHIAHGGVIAAVSSTHAPLVRKKASFGEDD